jgi:CubicO group peptidase (beta-lactamase class C family)
MEVPMAMAFGRGVLVRRTGPYPARSRLALTLALTLAAAASAAAQAKPVVAGPAPLAGIEVYIDSVRQAFGIPGMAVGVVKDDSLVFARGFGLRELGKAAPVDERTLFAIGSNTKSFTSTAAAMLVDDGKLKWNDRVTNWLPGFQLFDPYATRELTVRDVMSHRSGLGRRGDALWYGTGFTRDEILHRIRYLEPNAGFRTEMGYQNIMFLAAGQVIGKAAGSSWDEVVRTRILEPLGMTTSSVVLGGLASQADVSTPHAIEAGQARVIPWKNIDNIAPAGSINSNVEEMSHYLRFHLGNGTYQGKKLVSSANLGVTKTPHINAGGVGDSVTHFSAYGLGWVLMDYRGKKIAWHNGGIDGMLSEMWTVPEAGLGVVVLTNGSPHPAGPAVVMAIIDRYLVGKPTKDYLGDARKQWSAVMAAQKTQEEQIVAKRVTGTVPSLPLEQYAGNYSDPMYGDLVIASTGGKLVGQWRNTRFALEHWHYNTFRGALDPPALGGGKVFVTFQIDPMGKPAKAEVDGLAVFHANNGAP